MLNQVAGKAKFFEGGLPGGLAGRQAGLVLAKHPYRCAPTGRAGVDWRGGRRWLAGAERILATEIDALRTDFLMEADT